MSYNFAIWYGKIPESIESAEEAADFFENFQESQQGQPANEQLKAFVAELLEKYPEPDDNDDDFNEDNWVWSDAPLMNNIVGDYAVLGLSYSHVIEVMRDIPPLVEKYGVNFLDWQTIFFKRGAEE